MDLEAVVKINRANSRSILPEYRESDASRQCEEGNESGGLGHDAVV